MILGIDASNIRDGGGLTHLREVLTHAEPEKTQFRKIIVWSSKATLNKLPDVEWLQKETHPWLNRSFVFSFLFQMFMISKLAAKEDCSLLFISGGTFLGTFPNIVTMSQNMLPFEKAETNRFADLKWRLRFKLLRYTQGFTFWRSKAVIFLTEYARNTIKEKVSLNGCNQIIPHGINPTFLNRPKVQQSISAYSDHRPFRLLYVSAVLAYKHQWNVASAVLKLRKEGYPVRLDLVGGHLEPNAFNKLQAVLKEDKDNVIHYHGALSHEELPKVYKSADGFVFASSCENMPIILIEAMTAGLPIASSHMGPMREVLGDGGFYFDPVDVDDMVQALKRMMENPDERAFCAEKSYTKSINYSWKDCSEKTLEYLSEIALKHSGNTVR